MFINLKKIMEKKEKFTKRLSKSLQYLVTGITPETWFSPQQPLQPIAPNENQQTAGRQFDYPINVNTYIRPKQAEGVTFEKLRNLADNCDILRLLIETRKDQIERYRWGFKIKNTKKGESVNDSRTQALESFFQFPDGEHTFSTWLRAILEDLFVVDAVTIYPLKSKGGDILKLEYVDGATIKRVIDGFGRTPIDGNTAFQQVLKGMPAVNYAYDELIYKPKNIRTNKIYGYSQVEQIIRTVELQLKKTENQLGYYYEGNLPNMIFTVPEKWNPNQIRDFQIMWDEMVQGELKSKTKFVPFGINAIDTKPNPLKDEFDEWLARIICFCFSISPQPFIKEINRATAETQKQTSDQEGLTPLLNYVSDLINFIVKSQFGYDDIEFYFDLQDEIDPLTNAQIYQIYVQAGIMTADEIRSELGLDPLENDDDEQEEKPNISENDNESGSEISENDGQPLQNKIMKVKKKISKRDIKNDPKVIEAQNKIENLLKKYLSQQSELVFEQLQKKLKLKKSDQEIDPEKIIEDLNLDLPEKIIEQFIEKLQNELLTIQIISGQEALKVLNKDTQQLLEKVKEKATKYASDRSAELIGKKIDSNGNIIDNPDASFVINQTTRDNMKILVNNALQQGWSNDELKENIINNYSFSEQRSKTIARTETNFADNKITLKAYKIGGVEKKSWLTSEDDKVSDICQGCEQEGEIGIDDIFQSSGTDAPPGHPNCRCTLIASIED
jgi:SPP1 gp7 family putative phage head morphogenesis protein